MVNHPNRRKRVATYEETIEEVAAKLKPVLTVNLSPGHVNEIFMLEAGEWMPYFGGSKTGYCDSKTATLVLREQSPMGTHDHAYNLTEPRIWDWIAKLINDSSEKARAVIDGAEPKFDKRTAP